MNTKSIGAIILVGGMGTRLRPLTVARPKALMPVLNRPFLSYQFETLAKAGVRNVVLAASGRFKQWEKEFRRICPPSIRLVFAYEKSPLGTGGAIRFAYEVYKRKISTNVDSFFVFNGDIIFDIDLRLYAAFHLKNGSSCTIALTRVSDPSRFGLIQVDNKNTVVKFIEKPKNHKGPSFINAGVYLIRSYLLNRIPLNQVSSVERDIYPEFLKSGVRLMGFKTTGYWNDIGTPATYLQAHADLLKANKRWTGSNNLRKRGTLIDRTAVLSGPVCLGEKVRVGPHAHIENAVILNGSIIGAGAKIVGSIIGENSCVGDFCEISDGAVLGDETCLPSYSRC